MKIISYFNENLNAGFKAPKDVINAIENDKTIEVQLIPLKSIKVKIQNIKKIIKEIPEKGVILVQYPTIIKINIYKWFNSSHKIILLHDINGLRYDNKKNLKREIKCFENFEYLICHNCKMKEYLISKGIDKRKIKTIELFDYLMEENTENRQNKKINRPMIVYAGNLVKEKSPFLHQIDKEKINFNFNLYGVGVSNDINEKMKYKGSFEPDILPNKLEGDLGLVWDGNYDESDENVGFKNYTKYNNPHKLSCYIAAGLPVIVWRKAAISDFVKKYNIGYTISNIYDINNIDFSDYNEKLKNVQDLSKKVRSGYFTKRVMKEIFNDMGVNENEI